MPDGPCGCGWPARGTGGSPTVSLGLDIVAGTSGQPQVNWSASYVERVTRRQRTVQGHVEVRWSHGRFAQPPEAKVYLDTPTDELPGYFALERGADQPELWE